jgi:hypothetical protein
VVRKVSRGSRKRLAWNLTVRGLNWGILESETCCLSLNGGIQGWGNVGSVIMGVGTVPKPRPGLWMVLGR